jgi:hypothetical protein
LPVFLSGSGQVLATDTKSGQNNTETIAAVLVHDDHDLNDLTVRVSRDRTAVIDIIPTQPETTPTPPATTCSGIRMDCIKW